MIKIWSRIDNSTDPPITNSQDPIKTELTIQIITGVRKIRERKNGKKRKIQNHQNREKKNPRITRNPQFTDSNLTVFTQFAEEKTSQGQIKPTGKYLNPMENPKTREIKKL